MFRWVMVLVALTKIASADDYALPDFLAKPPPLPASATGEVWRLDLADALRTAVAQNFGITLERASLRIAGLSRIVSEAPFEPVLQGNLSHASSKSTPLTVQQGMAGEIIVGTADAWQVSLSDRIARTGTQLQVAFINARSLSNEQDLEFPRHYTSSLQATISQPLLKGFSFDGEIPQINILRAHLASDRERAQLALQITTIVEQTEDAYWDVVAAVYRYDLAVRSLGLADGQLRLTQRQIDSGVLPSSDLIAAQSTLARRQLDVVGAEDGIGAAWDALRAVMNLPRDKWAQPILPVETPSFAPTDLAAEDALKIAVAHRPEIAQADLDLKGALLSIDEAKNNELPEIDVGVTGSLAGNKPLYVNTLGEVASTDNTGWSVFLNFTWTPLTRATRAQTAIRKEQHHVSEINKEQLVQKIWFDVRDALRNQKSASRQVIAAAHFRELAEKTLAIEQRKFLNGTSFNYVVAQKQDDLANAQLAELAALLAHEKATAALARATGQLLDQRHIELQ